ncbi:MAG TPA: cytochrome C oxidase subunit IV family protein [Candidatus Binataceae bacterium]|nr:cytochrome C oxidase subunit IV family protein [Candidatus Binataceae bacterium]
MATEARAGSHEEQHANYLAIFIYLSVLTGIELLVYAMSFPTVLKVGLLVALALAKAVMVAMYFMHLALERKGLWVIAAIPMVLVAFCYLMLRPDLSARAWTSEHHPEEQIGVHEGAEGAPAPAPPADASNPPS